MKAPRKAATPAERQAKTAKREAAMWAETQMAMGQVKTLPITDNETQSVQQEIESTGEFDGRTVLGFLGDFGIGNGMAKGEARKKAQNRLNQLEALKAAKCKNQ
jgi:hypothetical protein